MNQSKFNQSIKSLLLCSIGLLMVSGITIAQVDKNSDLFNTLKAKDSILFKIGFNECEVEKSAELLTDDLEFYHDNSGVSNSKEEFIEAMKSGICRANNPKKVYRFLVEGSLEVFPMYDNGKLYGALQNGKIVLELPHAMQGKFEDGGTTATGTYVADFNNTKCQGTWNAVPVTN